MELGIDENDKIWVYEVNIRPDRRYLIAKEQDYLLNMLNIYLHKKRGEQDEDTLPK